MKIEVNIKTGFFENHKDLIPLQGELKEYESKKGREALKQSILSEGIIFPTFVWEDGNVKYIWDGHGRHDIYNELVELGFELPDLPVVYIIAKNKADAKIKLLKKEQDYRRRITKSGLTDFVSGELINIDDLEGLNLPGIGELDISFLDDILKTEGNENNSGDGSSSDTTAGEVPIEPSSKIGDYFKLGRHRLLCGSCTDIGDVKKLVSNDHVDLVLTDPPYGIDVVKGGSVGGGGKVSMGKVGGGKIVESRSYRKILNDENTNCAKDFYFLCRDMGFSNIVLFGGNYFTDFLPPSRCWFIWNKKMTGNFSQAEMAWTSFTKGGVKIYDFLWNGLAREGNRKDELFKRVHPTQKPVGMLSQILTDVGASIVFDGFGGSGSTLISCENKNIDCLMMELDPGYIDVIIERWEKHTGQKAIKLNQDE